MPFLKDSTSYDFATAKFIFIGLARYYTYVKVTPILQR